MVKIKLARYGKRNDPSYRIIAIDERKKLKGKPLEILGFWHPLSKAFKADKKAIHKWIQKGAQVSEAVKELIK